MKKIYRVEHFYDVDGGFGDAIGRSETIAVFENRDDAQAFVDKYSATWVYDGSYDDFECGLLEVIEEELFSKGTSAEEAYSKLYKDGDPWWSLKNEEEEEDDDE